MPVCVGQKVKLFDAHSMKHQLTVVPSKAINDRIKELDIQDCKVRVTNVDSQGSGSNIVIQVIGEMSNKATPHRKFSQTFVLAEQLNGYFVLNDIFRYILEDEEITPEEEVLPRPEAASGYQEPPATVEESAPPHTLTSSADKIEQEHDAEIVDDELVEAIKEEPAIAEATPPASVNGGEDTTQADISEVEEQPAPVDEAEETVTESTIEPVEPPPAVEAALEKPRSPEPTPAASPPKPAAPQVETTSSAPKPSVPKTWANLVAGGNRVVTPVTPAIPAVPTLQPQAAPVAAKPTPPPASTAVSSLPSTAPAAAQPTPPATEAEQVETPQSSGSEWQTAGHDHGKKQARTQTPQVPPENSRAYIKNVNDTVDAIALRGVLTKIAEVTYLDINRQKVSQAPQVFY